MIRDRHSFCLVISSLFVTYLPTYPTYFPAGIVKPRRISAATYPSKFRALVASRLMSHTRYTLDNNETT